MALPPAKILLACAPPVAVVTVAGRAAVERTRDFRAAVERLGQLGVKEVHVDLSGCLLMDSMFSGTLANLAADGGLRFTVFNANERIADQLENLGALKFIRLARGDEAASDAGPAAEVPALPADRRATAESCLEAHRFLMAIKEENRAKFETLERFLEDEIRAMPPSPPAAPNPSSE